MRPRKQEDSGAGDLFRARLDQIIDMGHDLVRLAQAIDWAWIDGELAERFSDKGRPATESHFMVGLLLLKHIYHLSDEGVCERWVYDPYFQHFTGEAFFQHRFPHERSGLTHWRQRLGDKLDLLLTTTNRRAKGGQFVLHAKTLPGNPGACPRASRRLDPGNSHTLAGVIEETEVLTGRAIERIYVDKGDRGHNVPQPWRVFRSGQKRGVFGIIKKELRRRSAIEAVIGHMKTDGHLGRPQLPQRPPRRPRQRRAHRRRLQPPPHPHLAEVSLAPHPRRQLARPHAAISHADRLLTSDGVPSRGYPKRGTWQALTTHPYYRWCAGRPAK